MVDKTKQLPDNAHMLAHVVVFWAVSFCRPVGGYKGFGGVFCFHLKGRNRFYRDRSRVFVHKITTF
jgi:hypothetical protein